MYTGDLRVGQSPVLPAGLLPDRRPDRRPDLLIVDGTYAPAGGRKPQGWDVVRRKLFSALRANLLRKGTMLLPCFALGRAQEVLALVLQYLDTHPPAPFRVYIDGQARELTEATLSQFRPLVARSFLDLYARHRSQIRWVDPNQDITHLRATEMEGFPAVVIASSGMLMSGSASYRWARELASDPTARIVTTGYLTEDIHEELFGREMIDTHRLAEAPDALPISGHSSLTDTLQLINHLSPRAVVIVHCGTGDLEGKGSLLSELRSLGYPATIADENHSLCVGELGATIHGYRS